MAREAREDPLPESGTPTTVPMPPNRGLGEGVGDSIGPYVLRQLIGEGGFGVVWLAERREPMVQRVAVKIIKPGMDSRSVLARFEQERQALAVMDHPFVARVFDGGVTPSGRPYFVMEHVQGEPITDFCDRHNYTIPQRLALFADVCEAVQHAHHKGIIHRDLKPSNILVTIKDERAIPKVIDFGVAKALSKTLTEKTIFTETGHLIGTPEYMSPEQAEMGALDIDTRTDVYSLGVILYELIAGVLPFDPETLRSAGYDAIRRIIREQDAPRPSTKFSTADDATAAEIARHRQAQRVHLTNELRRELDWIPLRALRKDRTERYATPQALARDVRRYLAGEALEAGPESAGYRLRKFVRRNRGPVAALTAVVAVLVIGVAGTTWGFFTAANRAEGERLAKSKALAAESDARRSAEEAQDARERAEFEAYLANVLAADSALRMNEIAAAGRRLEAATPRLRGWEWRHLAYASDHSAASWSTNWSPLCFAFGADDALWVASGHGRISRINLRSGIIELESELSPTGGTRAVTPDGRLAAAMWSNHEVKVWDPRSKDHVTQLVGHTDQVTGTLFEPSGTYVVTSSRDKSVRVWSLPDGREIGALSGHAAPVECIALSRDARRLASASQDGEVRVWDAATWTLLSTHKLHASRPTCLALNAAGSLLAAGSQTTTVEVFDTSTGSIVAKLETHPPYADALAFDPGSTCLAIGSAGKIVQIWDLASRTMSHTFRGHVDSITAVEFDTTGRRLVSGSYEGGIRLWNLDDPPPVARRTLHTSWGDAFSPSGDRLAICATFVNIFDTRTGQVALHIPALPAESNCAAYSADSRRLAIGFRDGQIGIWNATDGSPIWSARGPGGLVLQVALNQDGSALAVAAEDGSIDIWDPATSTSRRVREPVARQIRACLSFSPDGSTLAWTSGDPVVHLWHLASQHEIAALTGHERQIEALAFSGDGGRIVSGSDDRTARVWDIATRSLLGVARGHERLVSAVQFDDSGRRLFTASGDKTVKVWDTTNWVELATLRDAFSVSRSMRFSSNGDLHCWDTMNKQLVSWHAPSPTPTTPPSTP